MFIPLQQLYCGFSLTCHLLAGVQKCAVCASELHSPDHCAVEDQGTGHKHERGKWRFSHVESVAGGDVRAAAPEHGRFSVSAVSAERVGRRAV